MATTLTVAVSGDTPLSFPATCVGCGGAPSTTSNLALTRRVAGRRGAQRPMHLTWPVPHCDACARSTKAVFLAQLLPFALGFLVAGGAALVAAWYGATVFGLDEVGQPNPRTPNSWVLASCRCSAGRCGPRPSWCRRSSPTRTTWPVCRAGSAPTARR
jgi:hypothetical protein